MAEGSITVVRTLRVRVVRVQIPALRLKVEILF